MGGLLPAGVDFHPGGQGRRCGDHAELCGGNLVIHAGVQGAPHIRISATAEELLSLPVVRIVAGLPFLFGPQGRGLRKGLVSGRVKIAGMLQWPLQLVRFTRLMSVNG